MHVLLHSYRRPNDNDRMKIARWNDPVGVGFSLRLCLTFVSGAAMVSAPNVENAPSRRVLSHL
jgi:hypothetical protein